MGSVAMDSHHRREALLNWLRSKGTSTASEAADKFGVSTRTILRDVASLRERGEPSRGLVQRGHLLFGQAVRTRES